MVKFSDTVLASEIVADQGGVAALSPSMLERVDTGVWEEAQVGVQYFSPDQQGGQYGKVVRKYYSGNCTAGTTTQLEGSGIDEIVSKGGYVSDGGQQLLGYASTGGWFGIDKTSEGAMRIRTNSGISGTDIYSVWVDFTLTTPPSRSPSSKVMPTIDPTVLQRVDDMTWETAQTGVEYFAPDQHGGIYGKVIRTYYEGTGVSGNVILEADWGLTKNIVDVGGFLYEDGGGAREVVISSYVSSTIFGGINIDGNDDLYLTRAANFSGVSDSYGVWADYTKVTPPTTKPTGQPYDLLWAEIAKESTVASDPTVLQRVDNGIWETAQEGVQYFSPDQQGGLYGKVIRQYFGALSNGVTIASGVSKVVGGRTVAVTGAGLKYSDGLNNSSDATTYYVKVELNASNNLVTDISNWTLDSGFVDYTLTIPPSRSPSSKVMPTIDPTVLQRVDNLTWETAQEGVEYFSPDQQGGIHGKILRQIFTGNMNGDPTAIGTISGIDKIVAKNGTLIESSGDNIDIGCYISTGSQSGLALTKSTETISIFAGSSYSSTDDEYVVWVDYTLTTPPTTKPTGQPYDLLWAEIAKESTVASDPTVLQRVDNGIWETAQTGVEYFSPDNANPAGKIIRQFFSGNMSGASPTTAGTISGFGDLIGVQGQVKDSTTGGMIQTGFYAGSTAHASVSVSSAGVVEIHAGSLYYQTADTYIVRVDYIKVTPPTRSPGSKVMPTIDPTVLQRVDDMTWETAQPDIEYFAPDQQGGQYGKVVRKYWSGTNLYSDLGGVSIVGMDKYVSSGGYGVLSGVAAQFPFTTAGTNQAIIYNASFNITNTWNGSYDIWVDYTLTTPPTTKPTGQPFADPNSGMLKRVDTGAWEIVQTGVEYYSPNQYLASGAKCMLYDIITPITGSATSFSPQPSSTPTEILSSEGFTTISGVPHGWAGLSSSVSANTHYILVTGGNLTYFLGTAHNGRFKLLIHYV